jgi:N-methylhydantoinase B
VALAPGDRFIMRTSGGGGIGDPRVRDAAAVAADVAEGRVSADGARDDYGVVISDGGIVDAVATERARA